MYNLLIITVSYLTIEVGSNIDVLPLINQVERFGRPIWTKLVKAVEDDIGAALAQTIAS